MAMTTITGLSKEITDAEIEGALRKYNAMLSVNGIERSSDGTRAKVEYEVPEPRGGVGPKAAAYIIEESFRWQEPAR